jgi:hypothetical protein
MMDRAAEEYFKYDIQCFTDIVQEWWNYQLVSRPRPFSKILELSRRWGKIAKTKTFI